MCCNFSNHINKRVIGNWDLCLPVFLIENREGSELAIVAILFLSPQLLREEEKEAIKYSWENALRDNPRVRILMNQRNDFTRFFIWAAVILSPKGRYWIHAHSEVLGGVKILSGFSSRLYSLGDCDITSTWEFCSGPTPGPAEVTGHRAASGRPTLRTAGCPEGGGDRQVHLTLYCLVFSKSVWAVALWDLISLSAQ